MNVVCSHTHTHRHTYPPKSKPRIYLSRSGNERTCQVLNEQCQPGVGDGRLCVADGLGTFEGFASTNSKDQFGVNLTQGEVFDDNDNSGILKYVSIRYSGAILQVGGEINGLTLGSVGRGTTIDHIEVVSCAECSQTPASNASSDAIFAIRNVGRREVGAPVRDRDPGCRRAARWATAPTCRCSG